MSDSVPESHSCETYRAVRLVRILSLGWLYYTGGWGCGQGTNCINYTKCLAAYMISPCPSHSQACLQPQFQISASSQLPLAPEWRVTAMLSS